MFVEFQNTYLYLWKTVGEGSGRPFRRAKGLRACVWTY